MSVTGEPLGTDRIQRVTLGGGGSFTGTFVSEARDELGG
jgi:hypothetical protein